MAEICWFCGTGAAETVAAHHIELWGDAARPPDAGGHPVRAVHRRYVKIEVPVPSCPACAARRRRSRFGVWMTVVPGIVLAPLLYRLWLGAGPALYQALMLASALGAGAGLVVGIALRLVLLGRKRGASSPRPARRHPEIARLIALGWDPETPFDD
jgi:hypothetical protein